MIPSCNMSRVGVIKTRGWIRESVYWISTSRNYNSYTLKITVTIAHKVFNVY
jgi:hypothetical protein